MSIEENKNIEEANASAKVQYKRLLVTAALPYANGPVHIGHLAGCYIPADIYVRYQRAQKRDVKFVGGSDEHGVPITIRAMKEGITPQQIVDKYHAIIKESFEQMGISFDIYSRTSNKVHHETASDFLKNYMIKVCLKKKKRSSIMMKKQKLFGRQIYYRHLPGMRKSKCIW